MKNLKKRAKVVIRYTGRNAGKEVWGTIRDVWNKGMRYDIELSTPPYGIQFGVPESIVFPDTGKDYDCQCYVRDHIANEEWLFDKDVALSYASKMPGRGRTILRIARCISLPVSRLRIAASSFLTSPRSCTIKARGQKVRRADEPTRSRAPQRYRRILLPGREGGPHCQSNHQRKEDTVWKVRRSRFDLSLLHDTDGEPFDQTQAEGVYSASMSLKKGFAIGIKV